MIYKIETKPDDKFTDVAHKAKQMTLRQNIIVQFDFNGVSCFIDFQTNLDWLHRDFMNAYIMDWKVIGTDCVETYSVEILAELEKRTLAQKDKVEEEYEERKIEDEKEKSMFELKTKDIVVSFKSQEDWDKAKVKNNDFYCSFIFEYAEYWAKLMQFEMINGKDLTDIAEKVSFELGFMGITGFQHSIARNLLCEHWTYGRMLEKIYENKK